MSDLPHLGDPDMELALRAQARRWSRRVRWAGWGAALALAGCAGGVGLAAWLH